MSSTSSLKCLQNGCDLGAMDDVITILKVQEISSVAKTPKLDTAVELPTCVSWPCNRDVSVIASNNLSSNYKLERCTEFSKRPISNIKHIYTYLVQFKLFNEFFYLNSFLILFIGFLFN